MLDAMRRGVANVLAKILLGLLVVAFAYWGIGNYDIFRRAARNNTVATVGSTRITPEEFRQAYKEEMAALARQIGRALTPEQAQMLGVGPRALARLIGFSALDLHGKALDLTVSDVVVRNSIFADPSFQGPDGKFSKEQFYRLLHQDGYRSESSYIEERRRDLARQQLTETLGAGAGPQLFLVEALYRYRNETRILEHLTPELGKLVTVAEPTQEQLQEHFRQNKGHYIALEERKTNLLLLTREAALSRVKVTDEEIKAAYEDPKTSHDIPEKRRVAQLTFADKAAAEKAYAELSGAKSFTEAAAKAGFPATDIDLGLLTKAEMIDPKIADAAFALKKNELSRPVEGQFSTVLLRVSEIEPGRTRTFDEVKGEIRDALAADQVGPQLQQLHEQVEAERAKAVPLKEIAEALKLPFQEIAAVNRTGRTADGNAVIIAHPDAPKIIDAVFATAPGVETDGIDLSDGGYAWFELLGVTPQRERTFDEVTDAVRTNFMDEERRKEIASLVAKKIEELKPGEGLEKIAKALGGKVERTAPLKRTGPAPAGFTPATMQQAFESPKGTVSSFPTADGKSRTIFRVADVIPAGTPTAEEAAALKTELARQQRIDMLDQYVAGLRTRYGITVNEKLIGDVIGGKTETPTDY
ncbi:MAG: SurA N-terminal domain-containing protein [Hyphomicrobiaceae bacterium]|nr:SurA N-terminal domain-containing protein [Hyphomicrobiaceae bacterium]